MFADIFAKGKDKITIMSRYQHQKSGLFLMELLINLLLFCLLCGCGLTFFLHSSRLIKASTDLHHAVSITSSIAGLYESGDGSFALLLETYETSTWNGQTFELYLTKEYQPCKPDQAVYFVQATQTDAASEKIQIDFFCFSSDNDNTTAEPEAIYSVEVCHVTALTTKSTRKK